MSFGFGFLDKSFQTDIKPIQNPKQTLMLPGFLRLACVFFRFGFLERSFQTDIKPIQNPTRKWILLGLPGVRELSDLLS